MSSNLTAPCGMAHILAQGQQCVKRLGTQLQLDHRVGTPHRRDDVGHPADDAAAHLVGQPEGIQASLADHQMHAPRLQSQQLREDGRPFADELDPVRVEANRFRQRISIDNQAEILARQRLASGCAAVVPMPSDLKIRTIDFLWLKVGSWEENQQGV